ncbi:MAG: cupredoxin domain-containing protein [Candidatus Aadella gelida]|nr:cupredoxin domain-containing protein [Candidatus Aadella gelida]
MKVQNIVAGTAVLTVFLLTGCNAEKPAHNKHGQEEHGHVMGETDSHMPSAIPVQNEQEILKNSEVREIKLEAYQYGYSPENITVKKGDVVRLIATSRDVPHGIFIKEYGINFTASKGKMEEVKFVADKPGEFDILCSVYCGRGHHGMKAKLIVKE